MAEANSESSTAINGVSSNPNLLIINPANQITSVKLNDDNYLLWNLQVLAIIRGLGLEVFILDNPPIPSHFVSTHGGAETINSHYISWCRQDQLLFSFLLASMTEGVQGQMVGCETSTQLWGRVTRLFASRSKARVMHYKLQLQTLKKGDMTMKDYLSKMKNYIDTLAASGHPITEEDQILYILGGVGIEYESVVVHITSSTDSLNFPDVSALLLSHEGRIETYNLNGSSPTPAILLYLTTITE